MISAFGVDHGEFSKGLLQDWKQKRDLKHRQKFATKYPVGDNQQVRTKDLMRIQYRENPTKQHKIDNLALDLKKNPQRVPVNVGISRSDPNRTYLFDGHHRVNANHKLRRRYTTADIEDNEQHHTWNNPKDPMPGVWPEKGSK
jgi:hypothetical protein